MELKRITDNLYICKVKKHFYMAKKIKAGHELKGELIKLTLQMLDFAPIEISTLCTRSDKVIPPLNDSLYDTKIYTVNQALDKFNEIISTTEDAIGE